MMKIHALAALFVFILAGLVRSAPLQNQDIGGSTLTLSAPLSLTANLSVSSDVSIIGNLHMADGSQVNGYVLGSDASGKGSWVNPTSFSFRVGYSSGTTGTFSFSGLTSSVTWHLEYSMRITTGTVAPFWCRFNGDAGANYKYGGDSFNEGAGGGIFGNASAGMSSTFFALRSSAGIPVSPNDSVNGGLDFSSTVGLSKRVHFRALYAGTYNNNTDSDAGMIGGWYNGSATLSSIRCSAPTGDGMQYEAILYQVGK